MNHSTGAPTKLESEWMDKLFHHGCIVTRLKRGVYAKPEIHHLLDGGKRMGHLFTIPLTPYYHRAVAEAGMSDREMIALYGHSIAHGVPLFEKDHRSQRHLWELAQARLGYSFKWPESKIVPRRVA